MYINLIAWLTNRFDTIYHVLVKTMYSQSAVIFVFTMLHNTTRMPQLYSLLKFWQYFCQKQQLVIPFMSLINKHSWIDYVRVNQPQKITWVFLYISLFAIHMKFTRKTTTICEWVFFLLMWVLYSTTKKQKKWD